MYALHAGFDASDLAYYAAYCIAIPCGIADSREHFNFVPVENGRLAVFSFLFLHCVILKLSAARLAAFAIMHAPSLFPAIFPHSASAAPEHREQ